MNIHQKLFDFYFSLPLMTGITCAILSFLLVAEDP